MQTKNEFVSYCFNLNNCDYKDGVDLTSRNDNSARPTPIYRMEHGAYDKLVRIINLEQFNAAEVLTHSHGHWR